MSVVTAYCPTCRENREMKRFSQSHATHAVVALVTGGIWVPFWIGIAIHNRKLKDTAHCLRCSGDFPVQERVVVAQ
jgi:hypothetical protein